MAVSGQQDAHEFQVMLMEAMEGAQMGHVADQVRDRNRDNYVLLSMLRRCGWGGGGGVG